MNKISNTCYMCEELATSVEHVPPKCIFPEKKDLPDGADMRKQLLSVAACDAHNLKKSQDDEYLLYVLTACIPINRVGRNQYVSKIRRAINKNPSLLKQFANTAVPVVAENPQSGNIENTVAFHLDEDRFNLIIDRLSRAIYYNHYKEKWFGRVKYQAEFLLVTIDPEKLDELNAPIKTISILADKWFSKAVYYGENPEVFKYQAIEDKISRKMRLHFYEGCKLLLIFDS